MAEPMADLALVGLAVMGQNLILNFDEKGYVVCAFNRTVEKVDEFLAGEAKGTKVIGARSLEDMVRKLKRPRKIILLVKAGAAVDSYVRNLIPLLEKGDIIIDGGNSEYTATQRWCKELDPTGILYVGLGVSGGENGARFGASLMPGGHAAAWPFLKPMLEAISAKVNGNEPCCDWIGDDGAGHFVKMVHNGIEYADMQLIGEAYQLMSDILGFDQIEIATAFSDWNKGELSSYLYEITTDILKHKDYDGKFLLPKILDSAGQKGTGKWTVMSSLKYGVPITVINEAVSARFLSTLKEERVKASLTFPKPHMKYEANKAEFLTNLGKALYASKIISYAQGFMLLREAAMVNKWSLNYGSIALLWRGGCIIRSGFLRKIKTAYDTTPNLPSLLLDPFFAKVVSDSQLGWRHVVATAAMFGVSAPALSSALAYFDGYRSEMSPANLIQAQRDYFGAHTYQLLAKPGEYVHTNWTGQGGTTSASQYNN